MKSKNNARVYYYNSPEWFKGNEPAFYDSSQYAANKALKEHASEIIEEIKTFYAEHESDFQANFTPYNYKEPGWQTINLYSYFYKYPKNCAKFPITSKVAESIPNMCLAQISVLKPHTRLKAHLGDTNAITRHHLGVVIPGEYPELGLRINNEERSWKEGDVLSFCIVNRHYAWNSTDHHRIILMIDTMNDVFAEQKYSIAGKTLGAIALKFIATKIPLTRKTPRFLVLALQFILGKYYQLTLKMQRLRYKG